MVEVLKKSEPGVLVPALAPASPTRERPAVPLMIDAAGESGHAVLGLHRAGFHRTSRAGNARPALAKLVHDPDAAVRREALLALAEVGAPARDAAAAMIEALQDPDNAVAGRGGLRTGAFGARCQPGSVGSALPLAGHGLFFSAPCAFRRTSRSNRPMSNCVPWRSQPSSRRLKRPDARTRALAAHALADLHSGDGVVLPAFIEALKDSDPGVAHTALQALASLGQPAVAR